MLNSSLIANKSNFKIPSLWLIWLFGYVYAFVIALVLQKLVLPIMPELHAGHGLMNEDAIIFHQKAVKMAEQINAVGWSEWILMPGVGITANVGLLAALYAVLGVDPVWFIPLNAAFHALGALLILRIAIHIFPGNAGIYSGSFAAFLFLVFPSALVWYGQNHKDAFLIAGYLLLLFAFIRAIKRQSIYELLPDGVLIIVGCVLVAIMRPHMLMVYTVAFSFVFFFVGSWLAIHNRYRKDNFLRNGALMLALMIFATVIAPKGPPITLKNLDDKQNAQVNWSWQKTGVLPEFVEQKLRQMSFIRVHFIESGKLADAGSGIDSDRMPSNAVDMAAYLPRSLWVGLFAPFPETWLERPTLPRLIGAFETVLFYLAAPGILVLIWLKRTVPIPVFICLAVSAIVLVVLSYTSPNVGTLHRIRYGPLFVFMLVGIGGWTLLFAKAAKNFPKTILSNHASHAATPADSMISTPMIKEGVSGRKAVGAGMLVTVVSMAGALGLFIRDLLLINLNGIGLALDSYYLAMMLPMLFVSILATPLGDAFTSALHRIKDKQSIQALLGAVSSMSLLIFGIICLLLYINSSSIYSRYISTGDLSIVINLIPVALLLFLFSGLVVAGNSILNSLEKPTLVASLQLVVPFVAIFAILLASDEEIILFAAFGMVFGQLLNLVLLYFFVRKEGYQLIPGPVRSIKFENVMVQNYSWLVITALFASLSIPYNYWLAGQLGTGAVSIWAIGSKLVQFAISLGIVITSAIWVPYFSKLVTAGLHLRMRSEVFFSLVAGSWSAGLVALIVFSFAGPMVAIALPSVEDQLKVDQLTGVIKLGALQLPLLVSGLMLLKLSAVSKVSWKVVLATAIGLLANIILGYSWLSVWGVLGIAAAWYIGTALTALGIMLTTRAQSSMKVIELASIVISWMVLGMFALAIQYESVPILLGAIALFVLVLTSQVGNLLMSAGKAEAFST